jgi:hypothetical protein
MVELPSERSANVNGNQITISWIPSKNRNAIAKIRDGKLVISIPVKWSKKDRLEIGTKLEARALRSIEKGKWSPDDNAPIRFSHGQRLSAMGSEFLILFGRGQRPRGRLNDRIIEVELPNPDDNQTASKLVRKILSKAMLPKIRQRVMQLNQEHFGAEIGRITLRDTTTRWGSLSADNSMSLNMRLLFMPEKIRDYVIIHELAHTKYRSHGPRFWSMVERVIPDHRERRRWLRLNGWSYPDAKIPQKIDAENANKKSLQMKLF